MKQLLSFIVLMLVLVTGAFAQQSDPGCTDGSNLHCECVILLVNDHRVWLDNDAAADLVADGKAVYCTLGIEFVEEDLNDEAPPSNYRLSEAYPNPFNPSTNVVLSIARHQSVRVNVFNLLGQRVETIDYGQADAGTYTIRLDLVGQSSGTYVVQVVGETFVASRTVTLLK